LIIVVSLFLHHKILSHVAQAKNKHKGEDQTQGTGKAEQSFSKPAEEMKKTI
jgi:hypothetical protein